MICYNITSQTDDPSGIRFIESPTRTLKAVLFPRQLLSVFREMPESRQAGAYILYHTADRHDKPQVYIGQSGSDVSERLMCHNRNKDFWNYAIVFIETKQFMNAAHAKMIESILINKAVECGAVVMDNDTGSNPVAMKESDIAAAETWAREAIEIVKLLGLPFFEMADDADTDIVDIPICGVRVSLDFGSTWRKFGVCNMYEVTCVLCGMLAETYGDFDEKVSSYEFVPGQIGLLQEYINEDQDVKYLTMINDGLVKLFSGLMYGVVREDKKAVTRKSR